ncbi:MAG: hypothetical protein ACKO0Z_20930 [Betaproteobacteria bacterium]
MQFNRTSKIARSSAKAFEALENVEETLCLPILYATQLAYEIFGTEFVDSRPDGWAEIRYDAASEQLVLLYFHRESTYASVEWTYIQLISTYGELPENLREQAANLCSDADEREWTISSPIKIKAA